MANNLTVDIELFCDGNQLKCKVYRPLKRNQ